MERSKIAIIIPAYNEEATIRSVSELASNFGTVIVVDDCSKDQTRFEAEKAGAIVVSHRENKGYDGALNSGFAMAASIGIEYAITMDADGQHKTTILKEFIDLFDQGFELVAGVRPNPARISEFLYGKISRFAWGLEDPLCGMKGYSMKLHTENGAFDTCGSIGTELAIQSICRGCKWTQIFIPIQNRLNGKPRLGNALKANWRILVGIMHIVKLKKYRL